MNPSITLTKEELEQTVRNSVFLALETLGLKHGKMQAGKIYRSDMLKVISRRQFEKAVESGVLTVHYGEYTNSPIWAKIADWQEYLSNCLNQI